MSSTFLVEMCEAINLRHVEETMQFATEQVVSLVAKKTFVHGDGAWAIPLAASQPSISVIY